MRKKINYFILSSIFIGFAIWQYYQLYQTFPSAEVKEYLISGAGTSIIITAGIGLVVFVLGLFAKKD